MERLQLVALKFKMFRELAKVKEKQALEELRNIKPKNLGMFCVYIAAVQIDFIIVLMTVHILFNFSLSFQHQVIQKLLKI